MLVKDLAVSALLIRDSRDGKTKRILLNKTKLTIGKKEGNDLVLPRKSVSREHCVIFFYNNKFIIRDLGSANGTFVGGSRIERDTPLSDGATVRIGEFDLVFQADGKGDESALGLAGERPEQVPPEIKRKVHERLIQNKTIKQMDLDAVSEQEARLTTTQVVTQVVKELAAEIPRWVSLERLCKEVVDEALGLGPLEELLADESVTEIMVNNWDRVYVERNGKLEITGARFTDNDNLLNVIRRIISPVGRRVNEQTPMVDARLKDGSRVNAIIPPLAVSGPCLTIRKFPKERLKTEDLVAFGTLTRRMADFLSLVVRHRQNVLISGGTGSGKTTLLNVVTAFIPVEERIVTVEDVSELQLPQDHVVSLEAKPPNLEGQGAIPIRQLVINALRMRPDRIVVGECRAGEAIDMLQAMNTGHDGSLTTVHSNSPRDCLARLETLVLMSGVELPSRAIREQISSAVNFIVQQARLPDGSRKVTHISEVVGMEGDVITLQNIYQFVQTGVDAEGRIKGGHKATGVVPKFVEELKRRGIPVDMALFS
ncbi:MAG: Flp pilus assembly complex ATPase component TadA [Planctomycetes bacterium]|nr:Flp pilus assembly complex ATPase component TadA [Planctomycetota bacterium]